MNVPLEKLAYEFHDKPLLIGGVARGERGGSGLSVRACVRNDAEDQVSGGGLL